MAAVREGVHPHVLGGVENLGQLVADADSAQREIARRDRLGERDHVRLDSPMLEAEHFPRASETGDHLIGNQ